MLVFKNNYKFNNLLQIVFLCGSKFDNEDTKDKRKVLKKFIEQSNSNKRVIILEENFCFRKTSKRYLSYDEIFLKDLAQVEQLASVFADKILIVHETLSTSAELGMFAADPSLIDKICLLVPDKVAVEEDKIGGFIQLAFLNKFYDKNKVHAICYYPDVTVHRLSENKSFYYTYFHEDKIGVFLGKEINVFLQLKNDNTIIFSNKQFGKLSDESADIEYHIFNEQKKVCISVHTDILKVQLLSLLFVPEIRKELRQEKMIYEHVNFLETMYKQIVRNTIGEIAGQSLDGFTIKITLKRTSCSLNQAIGFFLYMLQATRLISLEQVCNRCLSKRKVVFTTKLLQQKDFFEQFLNTQSPTVFGRLEK